VPETLRHSVLTRSLFGKSRRYNPVGKIIPPHSLGTDSNLFDLRQISPNREADKSTSTSILLQLAEPRWNPILLRTWREKHLATDSFFGSLFDTIVGTLK